MIIRQRKNLSRKKGYKPIQGRTTFIGVLTLAAILSGILLYFTNERQQQQILYSYCSDFGFGGKSITLMRNGTFKFRYYGCSQTNGIVSGVWKQNADIIEFYPDKQDELLAPQYKQTQNKLLAVNLNDEEFVLCEEYVDEGKL